MIKKFISKKVFDNLFKNNFYKENIKHDNPLFPVEANYKTKNGNNTINFDDNELHNIRVVVESDSSQRQWIDNEEVFLVNGQSPLIGVTEDSKFNYNYSLEETDTTAKCNKEAITEFEEFNKEVFNHYLEEILMTTLDPYGNNITFECTNKFIEILYDMFINDYHITLERDPKLYFYTILFQGNTLNFVRIHAEDNSCETKHNGIKHILRQRDGKK